MNSKFRIGSRELVDAYKTIIVIAPEYTRFGNTDGSATHVESGLSMKVFDDGEWLNFETCDCTVCSYVRENKKELISKLGAGAHLIEWEM